MNTITELLNLEDSDILISEASYRVTSTPII